MRRRGKGPEELRLQLTGDPVDAAAAWREFHGRLLGFVRRRVAVEADAEDIVQKVFLQLHRNLPALRSSEKVGPWLHQAARNAIADHYRAPAQRRELLAGAAVEFEELAGAVPEAEAEAETVAAASCLRPVIDRLSDADRRAIQLVELDGLLQKDAAVVEGQSLTAMKTRVQRARKRLKAALLDCCRFALDARGGVMGCEGRGQEETACGARGEGSTCRG